MKKKKKRFLLDFWPYADFFTIGMFWSSVILSVIFAFYGGLPGFFAGAIFAFIFAGLAISENDNRKCFYEDDEI